MEQVFTTPPLVEEAAYPKLRQQGLNVLNRKLEGLSLSTSALALRS
jgi:hypothetical protein